MTDTRDITNSAVFAAVAWDAYRYNRAIRIDQAYAANMARANRPTDAYTRKAALYRAALDALPLPAGATVGFWSQPTYSSGQALVEDAAAVLYDGYGNADSPEYPGSSPYPLSMVDTVARLIVDHPEFDLGERYALAVFEAQANGAAGNPPVARQATFMADNGIPWETPA